MVVLNCMLDLGLVPSAHLKFKPPDINSEHGAGQLTDHLSKSFKILAKLCFPNHLIEGMQYKLEHALLNNFQLRN